MSTGWPAASSRPAGLTGQDGRALPRSGPRRVRGRYHSGVTKQIALRLPDELVDRLDAVVAADPSLPTRSAALHRAVAALVADRERAAVDEAIVDGYRRHPPGATDTWGDVEETALAAALVNAERLDAEDGGW